MRTRIVAILMLTGAVLTAATAVAQRPSRGGGPGGQGGRGGFDPSRIEQMIRQLDTNHNGMLDADEVNGPQKQMIEGMLTRAGVPLNYPIPITTIVDAMTRSFQARQGQPGGGRFGRGNGAPPPGTAPPSNFPGFGAPPGAGPIAGFGPPPPGAIPGSVPVGAPAVPAPVATVPAPGTAVAPTTTATPAAAGAQPAPSAAATPAAPPKWISPRLHTASERLASKGLPRWFLDADKSGRGEITMADFATDWTPETVARFQYWDLNGDGFITAEEVLKVLAREAARATAATPPAPAVATAPKPDQAAAPPAPADATAPKPDQAAAPPAPGTAAAPKPDQAAASK
jgi:Ca2+-binding EF-hand superfamily protein